jgi:hypothetical protein
MEIKALLMNPDKNHHAYTVSFAKIKRNKKAENKAHYFIEN